MKIGFDAKRAVSNNTGLGNYSRLVIDVLTEFYPDEEYRLYTPKIKENSRLTELLARRGVTLVPPATACGRAMPALWRVGSGIVNDFMRDKIDLFHGLSNELPLSHIEVPSVVTIHDLIFRYYPYCYKPIDRKIYDYKFRKACEKASHIIAVSECTKRDIVRDYGIKSEKIDVIYQGCHRNFRRKCSEEEKAVVRMRYNLPPGRFVLFVGSIEERKNALLAVKALRKLPADTHLVLVGRETPYCLKIRNYASAHNLTQRVLFRQISFNDLPAVYQSAAAFVYPSRYEGFGIPILEALCSSTPVVATTGSCLEEAGGRSSIYVDPDDDEGLADALLKAMTDDELRQRMIADGLEYSRKFAPDIMAQEIMKVYKKVLNR